jgi:hypothetical protein
MMSILSGLVFVAMATWGHITFLYAAANLAAAVRQNEKLGIVAFRLGRVQQNLRPFALPGLILSATAVHNPIDVITLTMALITWWLAKDWPDDDDPWKRRGKRALEAVKRQGSKLVVVPAGAPA